MQLSLTSKKYFSRFSYALSSLCLLHCLAMPFVIVLLPAISQFMSETVENILILAIIPVSLITFLPTWIKHKNNRLAGMFISGLAFILLSRYRIHHYHEAALSDILANSEILLATISRTGLMIAGVSLLAYSTYKNNKHTHVCSNPHHKH